jgi:hypothetical protein
MLRMYVGRQLRQSQSALHDLLTMIRTLLGVEVEDCALVIRKLGGIAKNLAVNERSTDNGSDIESLFTLCLSG